MINQLELNSPACDRGEQESEIEAAWLVELDRRVAELDAGRAETLPWEVVRSRLRARANGAGQR
jgi:putative addiction module component (TIGR02574 family)